MRHRIDATHHGIEKGAGEKVKVDRDVVLVRVPHPVLVLFSSAGAARQPPASGLCFSQCVRTSSKWMVAVVAGNPK
jgi:hypothetical protein